MKKEAFHCSIRSYYRASGTPRFGISKSSKERSFYAEGEFVGRSIAQIEASKSTPKGNAFR
jgi:hypothetical protein